MKGVAYSMRREKGVADCIEGIVMPIRIGGLSKMLQIYSNIIF